MLLATLRLLCNSVSQVGDVGGVRGDIGGVGCHGIVSGFELRAVNRVSAASRQVTVFDVSDFAGGISTVRGAECPRSSVPQQGIVTEAVNSVSQVGDVGGVRGDIGGVGCHGIVSGFELRAVNRVSVLQNFTSALLTGCEIAILQMIKTSSQLMEKRSGTLMTRVAAGERFMSLVRSQQCTAWSSDRSRRMRNPMRLQLSQNFLTCWILKEKSSQLMRWVARKILQRRYKNRAVIIYSQPAVGLGATAAYGAGDVLKMGIGGGASKAAQTLSDYYIKRAEQYHPVIPIGAGNEVTVVFQDGFQLKTVEEMALEQSQSTAEEGNPESPVPNPPSAESHLNGFNTDQMLKQLGNLNPQQFMSGDKNPQGGDAGKEGGNGG